MTRVVKPHDILDLRNEFRTASGALFGGNRQTEEAPQKKKCIVPILRKGTQKAGKDASFRYPAFTERSNYV